MGWFKYGLEESPLSHAAIDSVNKSRYLQFGEFAVRSEIRHISILFCRFIFRIITSTDHYKNYKSDD